MEKILSLVIPTNGVVEWVIPVLDSIYCQDVNEQLYEVVVTDNGNNNQFFEIMEEYSRHHANFTYKKTSAVLFGNQIEAFRLATGQFIKLINHRNKLIDGSLNYLIEYAQKNINEKTISFFLDRATKPNQKTKYYSKFDSFLYELSFYSSWSGGVACWKTDIEKALKNSFVDTEKSLFPHMCFVFIDDKYRIYNVDNYKLFTEIDNKISVKGKYDLFYAFGVEYLDIIFKMNSMDMIDDITKTYIKKENKKFVIKLYTDYVLLGNKCSYDLSSAKESLRKYYSYNMIKYNSVINLIGKVPKKIIKIIQGK